MGNSTSGRGGKSVSDHDVGVADIESFVVGRFGDASFLKLLWWLPRVTRLGSSASPFWLWRYLGRLLTRRWTEGSSSLSFVRLDKVGSVFSAAGHNFWKRVLCADKISISKVRRLIAAWYHSGVLSSRPVIGSNLGGIKSGTNECTWLTFTMWSAIAQNHWFFM